MFEDEPKGTASDNDSDSPKSKGTENGSISDIDFSDVDENIREAVKAKVASKVKNFQSDYTRKTEEVSKLRKNLESREARLGEWDKVIDTVEQNPELATKLRKTMNDFQSGRMSESTEVKKEGLKTIDRLIDKTDDPQTKEDLRLTRQMIQEETDIGSLKDEIRTLKEELRSVHSATRSVQVGRVEKEIDELSGRFGKDVVDKHSLDIKTMALKYPNQTVESIFLQLADESDRRTAFRNEFKQQEKKETERKKKGLEPSGESVTTGIEIPRQKSGRIDRREHMKRIIAKHSLVKGL